MILITGCDGFIAKHFAAKFDFKKIISIDAHNCFDFLKNYSNWNDIELILHQGAISSTIEKDINKIHTYNVDFTLNLFKKAIEYKIPIKYASSASVYGNLNQNFNPLNYYAISKLQIDYWVLDNIDKFKFIQGFRYFNVYGPGEKHKKDQASPIFKFTNQIKNKKPIQLFEDSHLFYRDFICVSDVVECVLNNKKQSGIFDLGTSSPVTFDFVAKIIAKKYDGKVEYVPFPKHLVGKYQIFTSAQPVWENYNFISVEDYVNENDIC